MVPFAFAATIVPACAGNVSVTSAVDAGPCNVTAFVPLSLSSKNLIKPALVAPFLMSAPLFITGVVKVGVVKVLLVNVSVVALPTRVSVAEGKVKVTSAVDAGPIRVTALVPLSLSSKNFMKPALVEPFFKFAPPEMSGIVITGAFIVGTVNVLLVSVCVPTQ